MYLSSDPDEKRCNRLPTGIHIGVHMGVPIYRIACIISDNRKSELINMEVLKDYLAREVALGKDAHSFTCPSVNTCVKLPLGVIMKNTQFQASLNNQ